MGMAGRGMVPVGEFVVLNGGMNIVIGMSGSFLRINLLKVVCFLCVFY